jgi:hypothetical protein
MTDYIAPWLGWTIAAIAWMVLVFLMLSLHHKVSLKNKQYPTPPKPKGRNMTREDFEDSELRKALDRSKSLPLFDYDKEVQDSK